MAWEDELFAVLDDLEQQAEAAYAVERDAELVDRSRTEYAQVTLTGRLLASVERPVVVHLRQGPGPLRGTLRRVGEGWLLLAADRHDWVVPLTAVVRVGGASERAVPDVARSPLTRLGLGSALRRLADARRPCVLHLLDGGPHEAVLARVGRDFVETADGLLVALAAVVAVQSREG